MLVTKLIKHLSLELGHFKPTRLSFQLVLAQLSQTFINININILIFMLCFMNISVLRSIIASTFQHVHF